ncbi:hypothetical protein ACWZHB_01280 [Nocardia sp. FBN12]|uniref:hypothetical protein n=1 Tax=Nocardia sp. FBN12 TaxID=3419766 RepID=UPI003D07C681
MIITHIWEADRLPDGAVLIPLRDDATALQRLSGLWLEIGQEHPVELDQYAYLPAKAFNVTQPAEDGEDELMVRLVFTETIRYVVKLPRQALVEALGDDHERDTITVEELNSNDEIDALLYDETDPDYSDGSERTVLSIETIAANTR